MPLPLALIPVLGFLKNNWQLVAMGVAAAALMGYIGFLKFEVSHYKGKYEDAQAVITTMKEKSEVLQASFNGLERKYSNLLVATNERIAINAKLTKDLIQKDLELNTLRVSYNAVSLFNLSKRDPDTPKAEQGDDGKASTPATTSSTQGAVTQPTVPLADIFVVSATNDANHWACVKQVEAWQAWYKDVEGAIEHVTRSP